MSRGPSRPARSALRIGAITGVIVLLAIVGLVVTLSVRAGATKRVTPPSPPSGLQVVPASAIRLSWNRVSGADHYQVIADGAPVIRVTKPSYVDQAILPGQTRTYTVESVAGGVESEPSASQTVTAPPPKGTLYWNYFEQPGTVSKSAWDLQPGLSWMKGTPKKPALSGQGSGILLSTGRPAYAKKSIAPQSQLYVTFTYKLVSRGSRTSVPLLRILDTNNPKTENNVLAVLYDDPRGTLGIKYPHGSGSTKISPSPHGVWTVHFTVVIHSGKATLSVSIGNHKGFRRKASVGSVQANTVELSAPTKDRTYKLLVDSLIVTKQPLPTATGS